MRARALSVLVGVAACSSSHPASPIDAPPAVDGAGAIDAPADSPTAGAVGQLEMIVGTQDGQAIHAPADWPVAAGPWNGKAARYSPATQRIVFETSRADITAGAIDATATDPNGGSYYVAGPDGGSGSASATTVLYVAAADGSSPSCLGCSDVVDGVDGVAIYKAARATGAPTAPVPQPGARIYANQNKDLPFWDPTGAWIIAGIELPQHAYTHAQGNSEIGGWVDLWAISADGKTWVQLTDIIHDWSTTNATTGRPVQCSEAACAAGCQGVVATNSHPFGEYACSAAAAAPPPVGIMRPVISHGAAGSIAGSAKIAWSERVGWKLSGYAWAGPQQVAIGDLVMVPIGGGVTLPAIGSYERTLTPTPAAPAGRDLWVAADAHPIGRGYETWGFAADDSQLLIASDAFLLADNLAGSAADWQAIGGSTEGFIDVTAWNWRAATPAYEDLTARDPTVYPYAPNAANPATDPIGAKLGHWEEPVVAVGGASPYFAFASSANLTPAWDPDTKTSSGSTFALEVWLMRADRTTAAAPLTHLSSPGSLFLTYPTDVVGDDVLYITTAPQAGTMSNLPGAVYRERITPP